MAWLGLLLDSSVVAQGHGQPSRFLQVGDPLSSNGQEISQFLRGERFESVSQEEMIRQNKLRFAPADSHSPSVSPRGGPGRAARREVAEAEAKVRRMRASGVRQSVALDSASRFVEAGDTDLSALFGGLRNSGGLLP